MDINSKQVREEGDSPSAAAGSSTGESTPWAPPEPGPEPAITGARDPARRIRTGVTIAGALVIGTAAGALMLGPALAASPEPSASTAPSTTTDGSTASGAPSTDNDAGTGSGTHGPGGHVEAVTDTSVAANAIGISEADLITALNNGQTMAAVATAHSVDPQKVIDALVADGKAELAAAVTAGTITQAQADAEQAEVVTRVTAQVNGTFRGPGGPDNVGTH